MASIDVRIGHEITTPESPAPVAMVPRFGSDISDHPDIDARHIARSATREMENPRYWRPHSMTACHGISSSAGCGAPRPASGKHGDRSKHQPNHFPHWFNAEFKSSTILLSGCPLIELPRRLCAPRPVLFSAARTTSGESRGPVPSAPGADSVYHLLGVEGLTELPRGVSTPIWITIAPTGSSSRSPRYYLREGKQFHGPRRLAHLPRLSRQTMGKT